ncbi:MAG: FecR domain-containing protein, partial [Pirellulales bacterium]|nr:FecR domain-containing protein [Pirellulales bacterium]
MSDLPTPDRLDEVYKLIAALHDKKITPEELSRLEEYVCHDELACLLYVEYTHLYANLRWRHMEEQDSNELLPPATKEATGSPILGFLGNVFQQGANFFSRGVVISLMLAIGLPALILLVLVLQLLHEAVPGAPVAVAAITQTHECVWAKDTQGPPIGEELFPGRRLRLDKGLVEMVFVDGATVILQGPATFDVRERGEGFLRDGRLVARVPERAHGFTIDTPAATVVDFGTEFGVAVDSGVDGGGAAADVEVFLGEVSVETAPSDASQDRDQHRLKAGSAARVELAGASNKPIFRPVPVAPNRFVRSLPSPSTPAERSIVADFSGGNGNASANQFPGVAGAGWASGWYTRQADGMKCTALVERANPLLDGGDYLRVLVERLSGDARVRRTVERRLDLHEMIDLTKPYLVS